VQVIFARKRHVGWTRSRLALVLTASGAVIALAAAPAVAGTGPAAGAAAKAHVVAAPRAQSAAGVGFQGIDAASSNLASAKDHGHGKPGDGDGDGSGLADCLSGSCYSPPDPDIAAGPNEVIETVNCAMATFDKTGTQTSVADLHTVFGVSSSSPCTDPRVIFIPWISRFALVWWEFPNDNGPLHFAVSTTASPSASGSDWHEYATPTSGFYDQPRLLATQNTLIVAGNVTNVNDADETYFVYNLSQLASGNPQPAMQSVVGTTATDYSVEARENTPSPNAYFVQANTSGILLTTITGDPANGNVALSIQTLSTPTFADGLAPPIPGGLLAGVQDETLSATYEVQTSNNHPVVDFSGETGCQTTVNCAYDVKLDMSTGSPVVVKNLLIQQTSSINFPSVGLDAAGNGFIAYSASDPNDTPSANALADNDSAVQWNVQTQASTPGTSSCAPGATQPCFERWGDYFGSAQDPTNPADIWMVSEYQASSSGTGWGTTITEANVAGPIAPPPPPPATVTLKYQTSFTAATSNQVGPQLELLNNGSTSIPLSNLTIRYWFTEDGTQPLQFFCDYGPPPVSCANVTGTFGTTSLGGQDHYLQVSFSSGAGSLAPGANTGVIQTRFSQTNWANMTQTNDYSFNAADTTLTANPTITVYNNGTLVYGTEP
jgi:hypothetical protein